MNAIHQNAGNVQVNTLEWAYGMSMNSALAQENDKENLSGNANAIDAPALPALRDS